jgi:rhamnosyltransferase
MIGGPSVAVLLAAFNGMAWIEEQLDSIQAQEGVRVSIFIRIDQSTDGTEAWCNGYASKHRNVEVLHASDVPCGAALNFFHLICSINIGEFDFVALSDQDDRWHADKLFRAVTAMRNSGAAAYSSNVTAFWPSGKTKVLDKAQPRVKWDHLFEAAGPGCTYVFSREFAALLQNHLRTVLEYLPKVSLHDWYIYAYAGTLGENWIIDPSPTLSYRQHQENAVGANVGLGSFLRRYQMIRSGWWFAQVRYIAMLVGADRRADVSPWIALRKIDLIKLALQATRCRRRRRDQAFFALLCLATVLFGWHKKESKKCP